MNDGQVHEVANSNLNVKFLGSTTNAQDFNNTTNAIETARKNARFKQLTPVIIGSTTGIVSTYAMVKMWPERKTIGLALFGSGLWSAYQGFRIGRS